MKCRRVVFHGREGSLVVRKRKVLNVEQVPDDTFWDVVHNYSSFRQQSNALQEMIQDGMNVVRVSWGVVRWWYG